MNLDKLTVNIKPLTAYQAIDLGMAVARAYYVDLWRLWWRAFWAVGAMVFTSFYLVIANWFDAFSSYGAYVFGVLFFIGLGYGSFGKHISEFSENLLWLAIKSLSVIGLYVFFDGVNGEQMTLSFWMFVGVLFINRASFERFLLVYLSRKLFDEKYHIDDMADVPSLRLNYWRGRISLQRMMSMPVALLENQTGKALKSRLKILIRNQTGAIHLHGLIFMVAEFVCAVASVWVFDTIIGVRVSGGLSHDLAWLLMAVMYLLAVAMLSPFYVASGFVMYLCKRSLLEGWDIELIFRKLAHRHQTTTQKTQNPTNPTHQAVSHD